MGRVEEDFEVFSKNSMDLVSVIVPVYNVEDYLAKCIDSILAQTYQNIEIILIDDGSTDGSSIICDLYAKKDTRIKVIYKENSGISNTRNVGLNNVTGEFVLFVDSDDYIASDMIYTMLNRIKTDKTNMVICNFLYVDNANRELKERNVILPFEKGIINKTEYIQSVIDAPLAPYTALWNKLYKREVFQQLSFPQGKIIEDAYLMTDIVDRCVNISYVCEPLYYYVQRNESIMNVPFGIERLDGVDAFERWAYYGLKHNNINFTTYSIRQMIAWMIKGYRVKKTDISYSKRLKELKKKYNILFKKILFENIGIRNKTQFMLFYLSMGLYNMISKIVEKVTRQKLYDKI